MKKKMERGDKQIQKLKTTKSINDNSSSSKQQKTSNK